MDVFHIRSWMYSISSRGCTPYQVKNVSLVGLWTCPISGHGWIPYQIVDVPHIRSWIYSISSRGRTPYQAMDVFHINSWMYSMSTRGCVPCRYRCGPYAVPESSLTQDNPPHDFSTSCSPPTPLRLVSCCLSITYILSSHSVTKPPLYCWLPDLYDLIGFHFPAPGQGPKKGCVFLSFPHFSTLPVPEVQFTVKEPFCIWNFLFVVLALPDTVLCPSPCSQHTWISNKMHLRMTDI